MATTRRTEDIPTWEDWDDEEDLPEVEEWETISDWYERGYEPDIPQDQYGLVSADGILLDWVWAVDVVTAWDVFEERNMVQPEDEGSWVTNLTALLS